MTDPVAHQAATDANQAPIRPCSPLPTELVYKVVEQSSQAVLAIWMRVSKDYNNLARRHLYSHPHVDPARLVQCLKVSHRSRPSTPSFPTPPPASLLKAQSTDKLTNFIINHPSSIPSIHCLRENLALTEHLHLISLPFPPDPEPLPTPSRPRSKAQIIRRSIEVLADFEIHARAGPSHMGYRGLFPNLRTLTLGITARNVMLRDDLPGGAGRLQCVKDRQVGLCEASTDHVGGVGETEGSSKLITMGLGGDNAPICPGAQQAQAHVQDQGAHNEIQRIRMSILGQKGAVIGALQKLIAVVEPPVTYATPDSVYVLPPEGLRPADEGYRGGMV